MNQLLVVGMLATLALCEVTNDSVDKRVGEYIVAAKTATNDTSNPDVVKANLLFNGKEGENKLSDASVKDRFEALLKGDEEARNIVCYAFGNVERKAVLNEFVKSVCDKLGFNIYVYQSAKQPTPPQITTPVATAADSSLPVGNTTSNAASAQSTAGQSTAQSLLAKAQAVAGTGAKLVSALGKASAAAESAGAAATMIPTIATGVLAAGGLAAAVAGGRYLWKNRDRAKKGLTNLIRGKKAPEPAAKIIKPADTQSWSTGLLIVLAAAAVVVLIASCAEVYQRRAAATRVAARATNP